ncbi:MAG: LamG domain-containing protein [Kiritimatiellae bacterium]|nr:LamG domain-containing protein [Kiritimatiellia bacterium]
MLLNAVAFAAALSPLFHLPFEGSDKAVLAYGDAVSPDYAPCVTYGPGVKGQAAHFGRKGGGLHFPSVAIGGSARGTVSFWYRPDAAFPAWRNLRAPLFSFDSPAVDRPYNGTGWISVLHAKGILQARFGSDGGGREWLGRGIEPDPGWRHVSISWDRAEGTVRLCVDGEVCENKSDSFNPFKPPYGRARYSRLQDFPGFSVGGESKKGDACSGWLDEFKVYDTVLDMDAVRAEAYEHKPLALYMPRRFAMQGRGRGKLKTRLDNLSGKAVRAEFTLHSPSGDVVRRKTVELPPHGSEFVAVEIELDRAGRYRASAAPIGKSAVTSDFWVLAGNGASGQPGELALEEVSFVDFGSIPPPEKMASNDKVYIRELGGRKYMEASPRRGSRFACRIGLPEADALYCLEWEWPDDKSRFADVVVQPARGGGGCYELQVGYVTGGTLCPVSGTMQTVRQLYWATSKDCAAIFGTLKDGEPAALASLRVWRVKGNALPPSGRAKDVPDPPGGGRVFGLYFEDPSVGYCFGVPDAGGDMPGFERVVDRTVAYMKYMGQNFMGYPGVWYHGAIGRDYQPRPHPDGFLEAWYCRFDAEGLGMMPSVNLHSIPFDPPVAVDATTVVDGTFNGTAADITSAGRVADGWHHQPPAFNGLHPDVQRHVDGLVDGLLAQGVPHKSFKGIDFYFHTSHNLPWLGTIKAGYNDWAIEEFVKDTGISVPFDRSDPERGRKAAEWLLSNARGEWVDWRCRKFAGWVRRTAGRISAARPDLKLCLTVQSLVEYERRPPDTPHLQMILMREGGLDTRMLADIPNLVVREGCRPMGQQFYNGKGSSDEKALLLMNQPYTADYWEPLSFALAPQLNIHDNYYESAVGGKSPLDAPWLKETGWRVSAVNPLGRNALKAYVHPFRHEDIQGITRGGFLIGTLGVESLLEPFAKAFTALPCRRFEDVRECSTDVVKVRRHSEGGHCWVYAVNTSGEDAVAEIPCGDRHIIDLATGLPAREWRMGRMTVGLKPYEFRAFAR